MNPSAARASQVCGSSNGATGMAWASQANAGSRQRVAPIWQPKATRPLSMPPASLIQRLVMKPAKP
ncbi:hypothetical protein D3C84_1157880 [compost metagenome]